MWGLHSHMGPVGQTHPWREVGFRFKVFPKVLVPFEVAEVRLQGECSQEEVGLFSLDTLREQHLLPQVPVVVVPGYPVTAGGRNSKSQGLSSTAASHLSYFLWSGQGHYLPYQSPVLNIILGSEVNDHRRPKLVDALKKEKVFYSNLSKNGLQANKASFILDVVVVPSLYFYRDQFMTGNLMCC